MTNLDRYSDCRATLDRALEAKVGLRLTYASYSAAIAQRRRFHTFRALTREANSNIYPPGHLMHNACVYDVLVLSVKKGDNFIDIHRGHNAPLSIEELSDLSPIA